MIINRELMDIKTIAECTKGSFDNTLTFPEVVQRLTQIGIERYDADLVRLEKRYYAKNGDTHTEKMPLSHLPTIAQNFDNDKVQQIIRAIQQGQMSYPDFLHKIMEYGTTNYVVYLDGKQTIYFGRKGEHHIEKFRQDL